MNDYMKSYNMCLRTIGPVYIGSGREISKKEYIYYNDGQVGILDIQKMYAYLRKKGLEGKFEDYLLRNNRDQLKDWLVNQKINLRDIDSYIKYKLDAGDAIIDKRGKTLQIVECVKDVYGKPYVPGSSIKGMLRTILLAADIDSISDRYAGNKREIKSAFFADRINRNTFLKRECGQVEGMLFRTLHRNEKNQFDAVNDILSGLIISDSESIDVSNLILSQKIEVHTDGQESKLNLLRECIKPDTEIRFTLTIDESVYPYTIDDIMNAVTIFSELYYDNFITAFKGFDRIASNTVFLGGGSGYVSKTIIYPLFGKKEGIEKVIDIFDKTRVPREHKHYMDQRHGAAPHIIKCTRCNGKLLQMGMCTLS